jgi:hypothetical protein
VGRRSEWHMVSGAVATSDYITTGEISYGETLGIEPHAIVVVSGEAVD